MLAVVVQTIWSRPVAYHAERAIRDLETRLYDSTLLLDRLRAPLQLAFAPLSGHLGAQYMMLSLFSSSAGLIPAQLQFNRKQTNLVFKLKILML